MDLKLETLKSIYVLVFGVLVSDAENWEDLVGTLAFGGIIVRKRNKDYFGLIFL